MTSTTREPRWDAVLPALAAGECLARDHLATEALEWLERAEPFLELLDARDRFRWLLARGDALGQLGSIRAMDPVLSAARDVAIHELEDDDAAETAWLLLLLHSCGGASWAYVATLADRAAAFVERTGCAWVERRISALLGGDRTSGFDHSARASSRCA